MWWWTKTRLIILYYLKEYYQISVFFKFCFFTKFSCSVHPKFFGSSLKLNLVLDHMGTGFIWSITIRFTQQRHFTWKEVYDKSWLCPAETCTTPFIYVEHQWCLIKWNEVERRNCYLSCGQCQHDSQLPSGELFLIENHQSFPALLVYTPKKSRSLSWTGVKDLSSTTHLLLLTLW